jgi:hypothetical protein
MWIIFNNIPDQESIMDRFTLIVDQTIVTDNQTGVKWVFDSYKKASKCWFDLLYYEQFGLTLEEVLNQYLSNLVEYPENA